LISDNDLHVIRSIASDGKSIDHLTLLKEVQGLVTERRDLDIEGHRIWLERVSNLSAVWILLISTIIAGLISLFGEKNERSSAIQIIGVVVGAAAGAVWQQNRASDNSLRGRKPSPSGEGKGEGE
jgi:hypothetical protein